MKTKAENPNRYKWVKEHAAVEESNAYYENRIKEVAEWTPEELNEHILQIENKGIRAICEIAYFTASRVSEICLLRMKDVKFAIKKNGDEVFWFSIHTEKRRDNKVIKRIPVSKSNNEEFMPLQKDMAEYYLSKADLLKPSDYFFGDPEIFQTKLQVKLVRKDEKGKPILDENGNKTYDIVYRNYTDNRLRQKVYQAAMRQGGFNPHLLRHARLTYLAKSMKYKDYDRALLIKSIANFTHFDSAKRYVEDFTEEEKSRVF
jgi:integrase